MHPTGLEHIMFCPKILVVEPSFKIVDNFLDNFFLSSEGIIAQIPGKKKPGISPRHIIMQRSNTS